VTFAEGCIVFQLSTSESLPLPWRNLDAYICFKHTRQKALPSDRRFALVYLIHCTFSSLLYASDLRTLSPHNVIVKYADDIKLLFGQHSSFDISQDYENICSWSFRNRLAINTDKTKEIVFQRPASRHLNIRPPLTDIERVTQATLLVIDMTSTLSTSVYVNRVLMQINQRLYLLSQLKSQGMYVQALHTLFAGRIMSKVAYALPAFAGQFTADERNRIGAKGSASRRHTYIVYDIEEIIDSADRKLFTRITQPSHCLYHHLPSKTSAYCPCSLRKG